MSNGATATAGGVNFVPSQGQYMAFNITANDFDAGTSAQSFCQAGWSTNNYDIWATMLYTGKIEFGGALPPIMPCGEIVSKIPDESLNYLKSSPPVHCLSQLNQPAIIPITFSPNPAHDQITFENLNENITYAIEICNISGQVLSNQTIQKDNTIDVSKLLPGLYIIKVSNPSGVYVSKLIKE
jgi:hypothetical protein